MARQQHRGAAGAASVPGLLALRLGPIREAAIRALRPIADVVLLDATGRDHPRRAGLALHLGVALDLPSVGVTHRPLLARGDWPADAPWRVFPVVLQDVIVGYGLRTRVGSRPMSGHAGWRTEPETATATVLGALSGHRTPEPLHEARHLARLARAQDALTQPRSPPERRAYGEGPRLPTLDFRAAADITKLFWSAFIPSIDMLTTSTLREAVTSGASRP